MNGVTVGSVVTGSPVGLLCRVSEVEMRYEQSKMDLFPMDAMDDAPEPAECVGYDGPCGIPHWEWEAVGYATANAKFRTGDFHKHLLASPHRWKPFKPLQTAHHLGHLVEKGVLSVITEPCPGARNGGKARVFSLSLTYSGLDHRVAMRLSPRLREVARSLLLGLTNTQIAEKLTVTPGSADQYVNQVRQKLRMVGESRDDLRYFLRYGKKYEDPLILARPIARLTASSS